MFKKESSLKNRKPVFKQIGGSISLYNDGEYWVLREVEKPEEPFYLRANSDKDTFPPTNWTVHAWKRGYDILKNSSWIPDDHVKIVTGAEVTKYKPCQRVTISFDGTPPKGIEDALGNYLPTKKYSNGRNVFRHQDNQNFELMVVVKNWQVDNGLGQFFIQSNAAGDMNPASDRNNQCNSCGQGGQKMMSWKYIDEDADFDTYDMYDWIESDKIKVSCSNVEEDESNDRADEVSKAEDGKNIVSSETEESSTGNEGSGDWINVEKAEAKNR